MTVKIAPSILAADFSRLADQVRAVEVVGVDRIHVDVMDGHLVPNLTMGPLVVDALRRSTELPLDVHLMITDPGRYFEAFVGAGAAHISFHVEATEDPVALAEEIRRAGAGVGLAINPETSVGPIFEVAHAFDMILIMTVKPGFGGQSFLRENLAKVRALRAWEDQQGRGELEIEVDGGIDIDTAIEAQEAGADVFVAGSSIFGTPDPTAAARLLTERLSAKFSAER